MQCNIILINKEYYIYFRKNFFNNINILELFVLRKIIKNKKKKIKKLKLMNSHLELKISCCNTVNNTCVDCRKYIIQRYCPRCFTNWKGVGYDACASCNGYI